MHLEKKGSKFKAFSLIELMVVIAIIAVISAASVSSYKNYMVKSRGAEATAILGRLIEDWIIHTDTGTPLPPNLLAYNQGTKIGPAFWGVQQGNASPNSYGYYLSAENTGYVDPSFDGSFINMIFTNTNGVWHVSLCTVGYFNGNAEQADLIHRVFSAWNCV
jgi:prepilin-type N-terminal cleavage/methylation domain-containing protein